MDIDDVSSFVKELNRRAVTYPGDEMEDSLKIQQEHMDYETKVQTFLDSMYEELNGSDYMDTSEQSVVNTPVEDTSNKRWKIVSGKLLIYYSVASFEQRNLHSLVGLY